MEPEPTAPEPTADAPAHPRPLAEPTRFVGEPGPPLPTTVEAALRALPIKGINRRRISWIAAGAISIWVLAVFVRQVGDASAAQDRAATISAENATRAAAVAALVAEKELIQQPAYVAFTARAYGLGQSRGERPFVLAPGAPELPGDAPGSASLRVGLVVDDRTPLDSWLELLFGPER